MQKPLWLFRMKPVAYQVDALHVPIEKKMLKFIPDIDIFLDPRLLHDLSLSSRYQKDQYQSALRKI